MASFDTNVNFRAPVVLRDEFYSQCDKGKVNPSATLRRLMRDFADGRITYAPKQSGSKRK